MDFSNIQIPGGQPQQQQQGNLEQNNPAAVMELLRNSPHQLSLLKERYPPLAAAVERGDVEGFSRIWTQHQAERMKKEQERLQLLMRDPMDPEVQKRIAEEIRLTAIQNFLRKT